MSKHYKKILLIGQKPPSQPKEIHHCKDDLVSLIRLNLKSDFDLIIFNPSEDFFIYRDDSEISQDKLKHLTGRISPEAKPTDLLAMLAIRAFHSVILSTLSGTDVILFTSDSPLRQYPMKISTTNNALSDYHSILPSTDTHQLLSVPWEKLCPLGTVRYTTNRPNKLKHLLLAGQYKLPQSKVTVNRRYYYHLNESLSCDIQLSCPFGNNLNNQIAVLGKPVQEKLSGRFLILPEPYDMDEIIAALLNPENKPEQEVRSTKAPEQTNEPNQPDLNDLLTKSLCELDDQISNEQNSEKELTELRIKYDDLSDDMSHALANVLRVFSDSPELYRMYMYNQQGLTQEEIGSKLRCDKGTVSRGLNKLEKENPGIRILRRKGRSSAVGDEYKHNGKLRKKY